jgi:glycosyltransferase involved in cell wall biosynthesis
MRGGGSEQQTLLLLRHLDRDRFEPHLYVTERAGDLLDRVPDDVQVHSFEDAGETPGFYFPGRVMRHQIRHLQQLLRRESIDVIYDRTFHMSLIADPAARHVRIPRVSTIVSPPARALPLVESRFVWLKHRRLSIAYRSSEHVIAVSQQAATSAESYYRLPADSVTVIHNPVDQKSIEESAAEFAVEKSDVMTRLICVGRMTSEKGQRDLIEAIEQLDSHRECPDLRVTFVGDGPLREMLESQARAIKRHRIEFLGMQRNPLPYMVASDAMILPSHFEGMPNVVLEAMALRIPVIATRAGGTVELEREEPTVFWSEPDDPDSLAAAILSFVSNLGSASTRVTAATQMVEQHHNADKTTRKIEDLLLSSVDKFR